MPEASIDAGKAGHAQFLDTLKPKRLMCRGDDDAALVEMCIDQSGKKLVGASVERRRRFVEDPDGAVGDKQLGHSHAALLAGRKITEGQMRNAGKADGLHSFGEIPARAAGRITHEVFPEGKIFRDGEFALHRISVAEIVAELRRMTHFRRAILKFETAFFSHQKTGQNTQQSRLSRPVRPRHHKGFAGTQSKGNIVKNQILTAPRTQTFSHQAHEFSASLYALCREAKKSPDWTLVGLARFGEIIYKAANTPAVGVNFILAPNME
ncbi:hypothetical protein J2Z19_003016 [Ensifer adhaerens]|uniref:Uncharacterized protein n=1 Tax=Ensifer adhaerens TaxID=106592 RepID=A0ACC5SWM1_ENSAD|nr:hypothetical protein [Ensifer adhaerens]